MNFTHKVKVEKIKRTINNELNYKRNKNFYSKVNINFKFSEK